MITLAGTGAAPGTDAAAGAIAAPGTGAAPAVRAAPAGGLRLSRCIFGTAFLFNAGGTRQRQDLLAAAAAHGFTHFDTAPSYGFGVAERDLAPLLRAHPALTVTTKVGLHGPGGDDQQPWQVLARKVGGKLVRSLSAARVDLDVAHARQSLEGSLRRLQRGHIDLYLLHQPDFAALDVPAWLDWFARQQQAGLIRHFGIEVSATRLPPFLAPGAAPIAQVIQLEDGPQSAAPEALRAAGRAGQITWGHVAAARAAGLQEPEVELLRHALQRNPGGAIVVDTLDGGVLAQCAGLMADTGG